MLLADRVSAQKEAELVKGSTVAWLVFFVVLGLTILSKIIIAMMKLLVAFVQ